MAKSAVLRRLKRELEAFRADPPEGCTALPQTSDLTTWIATISGPPSSPYAGGTFRLRIDYPPDYPHNPPTVKFLTKIYHPNIDGDSGFVGLNVLHGAWSPVLAISTILLSLQAFLSDPDPEEAVFPEIAEEYTMKHESYEKTAMEWTEKFAKSANQ